MSADSGYDVITTLRDLMAGVLCSVIAAFFLANVDESPTLTLMLVAVFGSLGAYLVVSAAVARGVALGRS